MPAEKEPKDVSSEIGKSSGPVPVSYNKRDLLTYAVGIGCTELPFVYELNDNFAAFPTYPIVLGFKGDAQDVVSFPSETMMKAPMIPLPGAYTGLDAQRYIEKVNDLDPEGADLLLTTKVIGVHKKGSGGLVETEELLTDKNGKVFYKMVSGAFMLGAKGFKDAGTTNSESIKQPARAPDKIEETPTSVFQTHIYRLSGDYNPLHLDPEFSKNVGFEEPILHGLCSMGHAARAVLKAYCDNDATKFKALKVRFASPVLPGQTLVTEMWKEGDKVIFITKVKETGKVVINNAYMRIQASSRL